jgi:hypothetical protein
MLMMARVFANKSQGRVYDARFMVEVDVFATCF